MLLYTNSLVTYVFAALPYSNISDWVVYSSNVSSQHYTIKDLLQPGKAYVLRVIAVNKVGNSEPSLPSTPVKFLLGTSVYAYI